jgi:membrane-bound metal-dependent hydrolase YbcI (DUF457 family)
MTMTKNRSIKLFRALIVLVGAVALAGLVWLPSAEGRAEGLDLPGIYLDPFVMYGYAAAIAFFVALYKAFRLLGYIGRNRAFSPESVGALRSIKYCAIALGIMVAAAGVYIRIFHDSADDPAGFLALCVAAVFVCVVVAVVAAVFEKRLRGGTANRAK